jgi:hypothetical protein
MITQDSRFRLLSPRAFGTVAQTPLYPEEALQNVIIEPLFDGTLCMVGAVPLGPGGLFFLLKSSALVVDNLNVLPTFTGVGRWIRLDALSLDGAHEDSVLNHFDEVQVPGGTLEAAAVTLWTIGHGIVTTLGYAANYECDLTLVVQVQAEADSQVGHSNGIKFQWDLNGDGIFETEGARMEAFGNEIGAYRTLALRERRTVTYASMAPLYTPLVRAVGWDDNAGSGWFTEGVAPGSIPPNSLEWRFAWA